jgi:Delta7-sterol 5-desaturase
MPLIYYLCTAALESGIIYVCIFAMPLHPYAILSFQTASFLINVYGHLGYEFSQHRTTVYSVWNPMRYINRTSHHHDHHKRCAPSASHAAFETL